MLVWTTTNHPQLAPPQKNQPLTHPKIQIWTEFGTLGLTWSGPLPLWPLWGYVETGVWRLITAFPEDTASFYRLSGFWLRLTMSSLNRTKETRYILNRNIQYIVHNTIAAATMWVARFVALLDM